MRKRLALTLLLASLAGVIVQDAGLLLLTQAGAHPAVLVLQGLVLVIAIALVLLARHARLRAWLY